ncbi:MAG: iron complex outermembrane recepter protein [Gallionellaceae bacterium]|nr:MAG: iron complex outermembrane recepter protein [Gallionellaceae bacterium]
MKNMLHMLGGCLSITVTFACATDLSSELEYFKELPMVLSASRLSQPLSEAPNAMTVIDREMIVASGFRSIPDLFKLVPGMYVSYYKGSQAFVSYHGSTDQYARRMQVMIDGRSVYMPPVSTVDWADLPITVDDIERIEVIRGPAAASHGANSTQGVISIITRDAGELSGASVSFTRGDKGINDVAARFGKRGEKYDYRMTLAYSADHGYDNLTAAPPGKSITQPQVPSLLNNSFDNNQARLLYYHADYHPNNADSFDIQFGFNHDVQVVGWTDKNIGTNWNTTHDLLSDAGFMQLGWLHQMESGSELNLRYYHIRHDQRESFPYYLGGTLRNGPITQSVTTGRDEIEVQHTLQASPNNRLVYGAAWREDQIDAQQYSEARTLLLGLAPTYSSASHRHEYRVFAHDEWRINPALLLNTGGMLERDSMGSSNISPRIALNLHVAPRHTLRVGSSIAYRTPALAEAQYPEAMPGVLYQPGALFVPSARVNSPGLIPEKVLSRELGYLGENLEWATSLDLRVFSDQVSDGIYIVSNKFVNGRGALYRGGEATLKHSFNEFSDFIFNFAHELASSSDSVAIDTTFSKSVPRNSVSVLYSHRMSESFSYSAAYYYQDAMQPFDRGAVDYQWVQRRMDIRIAQAFKDVGGMKGEVSMVVQNLFDQGYTEYVANNVFNRRGYLKLRLDW